MAIVYLLDKIIAKLVRHGRVSFSQHPLERDRRIEDVFHSSSRISRIKETATSVTPCRRISSFTFSARW